MGEVDDRKQVTVRHYTRTSLRRGSVLSGQRCGVSRDVLLLRAGLAAYRAQCLVEGRTSREFDVGKVLCFRDYKH